MDMPDSSNATRVGRMKGQCPSRVEVYHLVTLHRGGKCTPDTAPRLTEADEGQ